MRYRYRETTYDIAVRQTLAGAGASIHATSVTVDGVVQADGSVHLVDDRAAHQVWSRCRRPASSAGPGSRGQSLDAEPSRPVRLDVRAPAHRRGTYGHLTFGSRPRSLACPQTKERGPTQWTSIVAGLPLPQPLQSVWRAHRAGGAGIIALCTTCSTRRISRPGRTKAATWCRPRQLRRFRDHAASGSFGLHGRFFSARSRPLKATACSGSLTPTASMGDPRSQQRSRRGAGYRTTIHTASGRTGNAFRCANPSTTRIVHSRLASHAEHRRRLRPGCFRVVRGWCRDGLGPRRTGKELRCRRHACMHGVQVRQVKVLVGRSRFRGIPQVFVSLP